jgi:RND family efflux transporter MFP subunit
MAPDGDREIAIAIPEGEVSGFKPGQPAEVSFWSAGAAAKPLTGRLREVSPVADPATRTFAARISLKDADPLLPLGMTATVRFTGAAGGGKALVIPLAAVFQQGDQPAVWKVGADGTVNLQRIKVAALTDAGAVVSEGLAGGEQIVAAGVNLLTAGEKVRIATQAAGK